MVINQGVRLIRRVVSTREGKERWEIMRRFDIDRRRIGMWCLKCACKSKELVVIKRFRQIFRGIICPSNGR
jgi:hypothetical protein